MVWFRVNTPCTVRRSLASVGCNGGRGGDGEASIRGAGKAQLRPGSQWDPGGEQKVAGAGVAGGRLRGRVSGMHPASVCPEGT